MEVPSIFSATSVAKMVATCQTEIDGKWVPARPLGASFFGKRFRAAWLVFTGQADALLWPGTPAHRRRWGI